MASIQSQPASSSSSTLLPQIRAHEAAQPLLSSASTGQGSDNEESACKRQKHVLLSSPSLSSHCTDPLDPKLMKYPECLAENIRKNNSAADKLAGYVFQIECSLLAWTELDDDTALYLEAGEDYDLIKGDLEAATLELVKVDATQVQVKHVTAKATLREKNVFKTMVHTAQFLKKEHQKKEKQQGNNNSLVTKKLKWLYLSTQEPGAEQGGQKFRVLEWNKQHKKLSQAHGDSPRTRNKAHNKTKRNNRAESRGRESEVSSSDESVGQGEEVKEDELDKLRKWLVDDVKKAVAEREELLRASSPRQKKENIPSNINSTESSKKITAATPLRGVSLAEAHQFLSFLTSDSSNFPLLVRSLEFCLGQKRSNEPKVVKNVQHRARELKLELHNDSFVYSYLFKHVTCDVVVSNAASSSVARDKRKLTRESLRAQLSAFAKTSEDDLMKNPEFASILRLRQIKLSYDYRGPVDFIKLCVKQCRLIVEMEMGTDSPAEAAGRASRIASTIGSLLGESKALLAMPIMKEYREEERKAVEEEAREKAKSANTGARPQGSVL